MKTHKIILMAVLYSAIFAAVATELAMRISTFVATDSINEIDVAGLSDASFQDVDQNVSSFQNLDDGTKAAIIDNVEYIQTTNSVYQYPGYWIFWLKSFGWVFGTALLVALLQSYWLIKSINKGTGD